ncbi:hypothetical protein CASFOL_021500 [Castilleja foliolosa]|uniref:Uncharacterized protein n=1 Tax=Castilleja foliolosa TaxID=1961234 RepID=A0ABD3CWQ7_9LAMI
MQHKHYVIHIRTWPTSVLMRVFLSLLSLCSVTLICCLMISADVIGRLILAPAPGTVNPTLGLDPAPLGDDGFDPQELVRLDDKDLFNIFNPNAILIRLVTAIPTPGGFTGDPGDDPFPSPSELWYEMAVRPPKPGDDLHAVKNTSYAASQKSS